MDKILKSFLIFIASLGIMFPFMWLRGGYVTVFGLTGFPLSMLTYAIAYFAVTVYFLKKYKTVLPVWSIILIILIGTSLLDIYARGIRPGGFERSLFSLPDLIIRILAIFLGLLYHQLHAKRGKITILVCSLLFFLWSSYQGFDLWLHKVNFGTTNGIIKAQAIPSQLVLHKSDSSTVQLTELSHDYIVLDFWSSNCGVCIEKFPIVQKLFDTYREKPEIGVYGVHCWSDRLQEGARKGSQILIQQDFTFPTFSIDGKNSALTNLEISKYPTVLILNKQKEAIFRGDIEKAMKYLKKISR